jgi:hypothetical protein
MHLPACPICDNHAHALDVVDFNYDAGNQLFNGKRMQLSGIPVYYFMCESCGFTFSPEFRTWTDSDFLERIYNAQYPELDPDYLGARPARNAALLMDCLDACKAEVRHLDYGGGNGMLSDMLRANGWDSSSCDPFPSSDIDIDSLGKFNLITAFEVFEHVPDPHALMTNLAKLMDEQSLVLFSTCTSDNFLKLGSRINWWYCSPRVGHVSLYSRKSLAALGERHGLCIASFSDDWHCFAKAAPSWFHRLAG